MVPLSKSKISSLSQTSFKPSPFRVMPPLSSPIQSTTGDQDDDLEFPNVTREELLARCAKEHNISSQPFERKFIPKIFETQQKEINPVPVKLLKEDEEEHTIRIFQWNILSQSKNHDRLFVTTPTTTQHILNTAVGLDMKMTMHTHPLTTPQMNIYSPQLNIM